MKRSIVWLILFLLTTVFDLRAADFSVEPIPGWVERQVFEIPEEIPTEGVSDGIYYVMIDRQVMVDPEEPAIFRHVLKKTLNEQGLEEASQIYITFDPSYEDLQIHHVLIHRDGKVIDQLQPEKIEVFQRETDLNRLLYNGYKTASIILEGTMAGDVIDFAYTLTGEHPLFNGKYMDSVDIATSVSLHQLHYRWSVPEKSPFYTRFYNTDEQFSVTKKNGRVEYVLSLKHIEPLLSDDSLPSWYYPYPWVQVSQFESWQEVAQWEADFYPWPKTVSEALQEKIESLRVGTSSEEEIIEKALCSVQKEIRYLGIEIGEGSHKPNDPSVVFKRKFGDCKDKAFLLCTILSRLGIQARPALVSSSLEWAVEENLPASFVFDHVIVRVENKGGEVYWLDPTGECQEVSLARQYQALYGRALVVDEATTQLEDTGTWTLTEPDTAVSETFDLTNGVGKPALLTIRSVYSGYKADQMRWDIESAGIQQTSRDYLNYYAGDYPSIEEKQPMDFEDNPETNRFTVTEYYRIPDFWVQNKEEGGLRCDFFPNEFYHLVQKPQTVLRSMPLGVVHPRYMTQTTTVNLPEEWNVEPDQFVVDNDALNFEYRIAYGDTTLTFDYSYRTKADFVSLEKVKFYLADLDAIYNELGYSLYYNSQVDAEEYDDSFDLGGYSVGLTVIGFILAAAAFFLVWRYDPAPREPVPTDPLQGKSPEGIGGWLILVVIGLLLYPITLSVGIFEWMPDFYIIGYWGNIATSAKPGLAWAAVGVVAFEFAFNLILVSVSIAMIFLFFKKRSSFPYLFIAMRIIFCLFVAMDILAIYYLFVDLDIDLSVETRTLGRMIFSALIWCTYMVKSKRVRNTFTRRRVTVPAALSEFHGGVKQPSPLDP